MSKSSTSTSVILADLQRGISEEIRDRREAAKGAPPPPDEYDESKLRYGKAPGANKAGLEVCATCGKPPTETGNNLLPKAFLFRDVLSAQEYYISGICQTCQDVVFDPDDTEGEEEEEEEDPTDLYEEVSEIPSDPESELAWEDPQDKTDKCGLCMYWSSKIARFIGLNPLEALCLNMLSANHSQYTKSADGCESGVKGPPIDDHC